MDNSQRKLLTLWFKGVPESEKEELETLILRNNILLEQLTKVVKSKVKKPKKTDYDNPNWAYHRADMDGYNRALTEILSLVDLQGEDNE